MKIAAGLGCRGPDRKPEHCAYTELATSSRNTAIASVSTLILVEHSWLTIPEILTAFEQHCLWKIRWYIGLSLQTPKVFPLTEGLGATSAP
jgi:hypothetical protein